MIRSAIAALAAILVIAGAASAATWHVDVAASAGGDGSPAAPLSTIQSAISAAANGDVIIVQPGTYNENINFLGKNITVRGTDPTNAATIAATVIDGSAATTVVTIASGETSAAILEGFTITDGFWQDQLSSGAGGIFIHDSSPTIRNNVITGNHTASEGGGIAVSGNSSPLIQNNTISFNSSDAWGGGIAVFGEVNDSGVQLSTASPSIVANVIEGNSAFWDGGGVAFVMACTGTIQNCIIADNAAGQVGGGIFVGFEAEAAIVSNTIIGNEAEGSDVIEAEGTVQRNGYGGGLAAWFSGPTVVNSTIFYANMAEMSQGGNISLEGDAQLTVVYCNVPGGQSGLFLQSHTPAPVLVWGTGNVDVDPLFASDHFHLSSTAGRYDPATGTFVSDAFTSPLIDAADPALDFSAESSYNGGRRNMGAYGNTLQASRTPPAPPFLQVGAARFDYAGGLIYFDLVMLDNGGLVDGIIGFSSGAAVSGAGAANLSAATDQFNGSSSAEMDSALAPDSYAWSTFGGNVYTDATDNFFGFEQTASDFDQAVQVSSIAPGSILGRYVFNWDGSFIDELIVSMMGYSDGEKLGLTEYDGSEVSTLEPTVVNDGENIVRPLTIAVNVADWVYLNARHTTEERHRIPLSVEIIDDNGNQNTSYVVTVTQTGGTGLVMVDPDSDPDPLVIDVIGGYMSATVNNSGAAELKVVVTGDKGGVAIETVTITVRRLGDVNGNGLVEPNDKSALNNRLNGVIMNNIESRAFDINADGYIEPNDQSLLNNLINGIIID